MNTVTTTGSLVQGEILVAVNHPFLRHLRAEKKFFTYKLTASSLPEKLWAKKPNYTSLGAGMKSAAEAESELTLAGAAHGGPFVPGSGGYFYNLGGGDLTQAAAEAIAEYKSRMTPGNALGYYFTADSQRFFYDLDGCRNPETGELTEKAYEAIALFRPVGAYMEVSPSGTGIHIVGSYIGERPAHETLNDEFGLELYTGDRGMAIGTPYEGTGSPDADCTLVLQCLIGLYFPKRTVERPSVDLSTMGDLSAPDIEAGLEYLSSACSEFERAELWNNGMTKFFFTVGTLVARGVLSEEGAWAKVCEVPKLKTYLSEAEWTVTNNWARGIRDSSDKPWVSPGDRAQAAGFGDAPLPPGASLTPVVTLAPALTVPSGSPDELTPEDFWAHLPSHSYINRRTREHFSVDAVNGHLRRFTDRLGMKPAQWLDIYHATQQMSWQPGHPEIIEGTIADKGHLRPDPKGRVYNLYRPSEAVASEADSSPWVNHVRLLYPGDADHLMKWFAYRIQNPGDKINHALVIGGAQGIGKDLMLEPLRYGVGKHNLADVNPGDLFKDFTTWVESTLVIINEARDLGDIDRYKFYESAKRFIAASPDTLPCNKKYLASYDVPNVMGVIFTSNHKVSGLYIDPDDRRHYVAWSSAEKQPAAYFDRLWTWMHEEGGKQAALGFLQRLNIGEWNAKEPPPKTEAWHQIVAANSNPEETTLSDALEGIQIATVKEIVATVQFRGHLDLAMALTDKKTYRRIPHMLERAGFEALPNPYAKSDGRWVINGKRETLYADRKLSNAERLALAAQKSIPPVAM
jgi:Family of unknown function (DUF5906)